MYEEGERRSHMLVGAIKTYLQEHTSGHSSVKYTLRELRASPSSSRTISTPTISIG
jgi:hypothetical protein